jgi:alcohol dehydrogenase class IV
VDAQNTAFPKQDPITVGVGREHFAAIAAAAMQSMMVKTNPRPITSPEQILQILEQPGSALFCKHGDT